MNTRAVHLEVANDLSSSAFIHVLRQFGCRRGFPDKLYSDNGSNYRKASKEIVNGLNSWPENEIAEFCSLRKCQWYFNPPLAPHIGGA